MAAEQSASQALKQSQSDMMELKSFHQEQFRLLEEQHELTLSTGNKHPCISNVFHLIPQPHE